MGALLAANPQITNPNRIFAGQAINIPTAARAERAVTRTPAASAEAPPPATSRVGTLPGARISGEASPTAAERRAAAQQLQRERYQRGVEQARGIAGDIAHRFVSGGRKVAGAIAESGIAERATGIAGSIAERERERLRQWYESQGQGARNREIQRRASTIIPGAQTDPTDIAARAAAAAGTPGGAGVAPSTTHAIQAGETLSGIAAMYGTTVDALMAANPQITNPNLIYAGENLTIPGGAAGAGTGTPAPGDAPATTPTPPAAPPKSPEEVDTSPEVDEKPEVMPVTRLEQDLLRIFNETSDLIKQFKPKSQEQRYKDLQKLVGTTSSNARTYLETAIRPILNSLERQGSAMEGLFTEIGRTGEMINAEYELLYQRIDFRDDFFSNVREAEGETSNPLSVSLAVHRLSQAENDVEKSLRRIERWTRVREVQREQADLYLKQTETAGDLISKLSEIEGQESEERIALMKLAAENPELKAIMDTLSLQRSIISTIGSIRTGEQQRVKGEAEKEKALVDLEIEKLRLERARLGGGGMTAQQWATYQKTLLEIQQKERDIKDYESERTGAFLDIPFELTYGSRGRDAALTELTELLISRREETDPATGRESGKAAYDAITKQYGTDVGTSRWIFGSSLEDEARTTAEAILADLLALRAGEFEIGRNARGVRPTRFQETINFLYTPREVIKQGTGV